MFSAKKGFTLSEVLITLMILGVISVLTIPSLIKNINDKLDVAKVKSAHSKINQALIRFFTDNPNFLFELPHPNSSYDYYNRVHFEQIILPYLRTSKICNHNASVCKSLQYKNFSNADVGTYTPLAILADGIMIVQMDVSLFLYEKPRDTYGTIMFDINGYQEPNRYGYDVFFFEYNQNGITLKTALDTGYDRPEYCQKDSNDGRTTNLGKSCSFWVITHGNMDYKYRDLYSTKEWKRT